MELHLPICFWFGHAVLGWGGIQPRTLTRHKAKALVSNTDRAPSCSIMWLYVSGICETYPAIVTNKTNTIQGSPQDFLKSTFLYVEFRILVQVIYQNKALMV